MIKVNFRPRLNQVLCIMPHIKDTTDSGIYMGETEIQKKESEVQQYLTVVAVGEEVTDIKPGDNVFVDGGAKPSMLILDDVRYIMFRSAHILGIYE